jgi:hypothetical protein
VTEREGKGRTQLQKRKEKGTKDGRKKEQMDEWREERTKQLTIQPS